jgi:hypothetical protein
VDVRDRGEVELAYAGLVPPKPMSRWLVALFALLASGVVAVAVILAWRAIHVDDDESAATARAGGKVRRAYERPRPPPAPGAFVDGGTPARDAALEQLFTRDLVDYVLGIDRLRRGAWRGDRDRESLRKQLLSNTALTSRGAGLTTAWTELVEVIDRWVDAPNSGSEWEDIADEIRIKARAVSDQLAAAGVGLYLEGNVRGGEYASAIVYTYLVEEVAFVVAEGQRRRVLYVRRIDKLNRSWALLGMHSEDLGDPLVMLDKIDRYVVETVLPVLGENARYAIGDKRIEAEVGASIRRELSEVLGADAPTATKIAGLLAERDRIADRWRERLQRHGLRLPRIETLYVEDSLLEQLGDHVTADEIARVHAIDDQLEELHADRIAARLTDVVAASTRRHEARHGIDADRSPGLRYPVELERLLGERIHDGEVRRRVESAEKELAAYLSEIANNPTAPKLALWHLAKAVFDPNVGGVELYAGIVVLEAIGKHLGVEPDPDKHADREKLFPQVHAIAAASTAQLRKAAAAAWQDLYGEPLLVLSDR